MSNATLPIVSLETSAAPRSTSPATDGFDVLLGIVAAGAVTEGVTEVDAADQSSSEEDVREEKTGEIVLGNPVGFMPPNTAVWSAIRMEGMASLERQPPPVAEGLPIEKVVVEGEGRSDVQAPAIRTDTTLNVDHERLSSVVEAVENAPRHEREVETEPIADRHGIDSSALESISRRPGRPSLKDAALAAGDKGGETPAGRMGQPAAPALTDQADSTRPSSRTSGARNKEAERRPEAIWIESNRQTAGRIDTGLPVPAPAGMGVELPAVEGKAPAGDPVRPASSNSPIDWLGLAKRIDWRWKDGDGEVSLDLHPRELGRVVVRLEASRDVVNVRLEVNNDAARAGLTQHVDDLSRALRDLGWKVDSVRVDLGGAGGSAADGRGRGGARDGADSPFRNGGEPSENRAMITYADFGPRHRVDLVA